jgi:hypothetical protein
MSDLQERLTKFIKHYEEFREVYKKWTPEEIAFAACKTGQFKTLNLDFVRQQREQLKAFMRWQENQDIEQFDDQPATIERYLESL